MTSTRFPLRFAIPLVGFLALAHAAPAAAQEPGPEDEPRTFERKYIDATDYRSDPVLLQDWAELTRLLRWTRRLEFAVAEEDATFPADLIVGFRARIDTLSGEPLPEFLASRTDTIRATFESIRGKLARAEAALDELAPPPTKPTGERAANTPDRERTLVTGRTAVTVPAGVVVGRNDTLPAAEVGGEPVSFVDLVALALADLDRLVHLVRTTRSAAHPTPGEDSSTERGSPESEAPRSNTAPRPPRR